MMWFLSSLYLAAGALLWIIDKAIDPDLAVPKWWCYLWWPLGLLWPARFLIW
jgi:hypothetical protein